MRLLWGDFHTHLEELERGDELMQAARDNIDFCAVLCYPFIWESHNGLQVETVGQHPRFLEWWKEHTRLAAGHYEPGKFTTYLGYEWHGDRTRWGDHNVIYRDAVGELEATMKLAELYERLRNKNAFVIPHHTAYTVGQRGKDWDVWDADLSPVMEIYSGHGSSEGTDTPRSLTGNSSMGPRASGSSYQDALARGCRIGCIGSNDGPGLAGRWNWGRAAVWAAECTRESIWEAVSARRTYAVTGDRILLDFSVAGVPMGSVGSAADGASARVSATGSAAVDRVELLQNGLVVDTYCHNGRWETSGASRRYKIRFVAGWGPCTQYGYKPPDTWSWECTLDIHGGVLLGVEKCFDRVGQSVPVVEPHRCRWHMETTARVIRDPPGMTQGLVFEIEGSPETLLDFEVDGVRVQKSVGEMSRQPLLVPMLDESVRRARDTFELDAAAVGNPDSFYHNARKFKLHRAIPEAGFRVEHTFGDIALEKGVNHFYVRVTQQNGQIAWSSPVWIKRDGASKRS